MVGLTTAKALALAWEKPFVAVNHLEAHALTARLTAGVSFPYLLLLISGGHCQLLRVDGVGAFQLYGTTIDDAIGEAFDKVAKLVGLPYPGGPNLEALARSGDPKRFPLPRPMMGRDNADFSFSGLKTAVRHVVRSDEFRDGWCGDLAASFQAAVIASLADRVAVAMRNFRAAMPNSGRHTLVIAGGVAANAAIRTALITLAAREAFETVFPPPALCTDNGAMVAWAGLERAAIADFDPLSASPKPRWPLAKAIPAVEVS
jgi:N6-L-threonylcarbamoyladenine synthase